VNDFDYLPEYGWPAAEAPYGRYSDFGTAPPSGRHRGAEQPDYAPPGSNDVPQRLLTDGRRAPGRPPRGPRNGQGYPPASGPRPAYQPPYGGPAPGYPPPVDVPAPPYRPYPDPGQTYWPDGSDYGPAYRPDFSGPMSAARSGPMPAYRPPNGRPAPGYPRPSTSLLGEYPGEPVLTYPPPADWVASERSPATGKQILGWLPFGHRLVLLPKEPGVDGAELRQHRDVNGGWLRPAVFGAMDGLVTNSSLIAGVGAGGGAHGAIVLTGIAGLIAGAFSMATGEYISVSSQNELTQAEVELERKQHARDPAGKLRRLAQLFMEKGVSPNLAEAVVRQISADPDRAVATHVREELGLDPDDLPSPRTAAVASLASFTIGALIPLTPFLVGYPVLNVALAISGAAAFAGGAAVAKLTGRSMLLGGLRQFTAAALATAAAFLIGHAVGGHIA